MELLSICLLSFCLFLTSCGKTVIDYSVKGEFIYTNRLSDTVNIYLVGGINKARDYFTLAPDASISIITTDDGPQYANPADYRAGISADTVKVLFNDTLCYAEYDKQGPILHNISKYTNTKRGNSDYVFYLDIDSIILNKASQCQ